MGVEQLNGSSPFGNSMPELLREWDDLIEKEDRGSLTVADRARLNLMEDLVREEKARLALDRIWGSSAMKG